MSLYKKIGCGVLFFILLLILMITFLTCTTNGLHLLFNCVSRFSSGLEIKKVSGYWNNLYLKDIRYSRPGVAITVDELHMSLKFNYLKKRIFYIDSISVKDVKMTVFSEELPKSEQEEKKYYEKLFSMFIPSSITIHQLEINNINLNIDNSTFSLMYVRSGLYWNEKNLTLYPTLLQELLITTPKLKEVKQKKDIQSEIRKIQMKRVLFSEMLKQFVSKSVFSKMSSRLHFPLNFNIKELKGEKIHLKNTNVMVNNIMLKFSNIKDDMNLNLLSIDLNQGKINASGYIKLHDNYPIDITINGILNLGSSYTEKLKIQINGSLYKMIEVSTYLSGPQNIALHAKTQLEEDGVPLNINIISTNITWPFLGEKQYQVSNLNLKINGKVTGYTVLFSTFLTGPHIPPVDISFSAQGNEKQINLNKLIISSIEKTAEITASFNWKESMIWSGELKINTITNTKKSMPDYLSELNGVIKAYGSINGSNWSIKIPKIKLIGNIKNNKVHIEGALQGNNYLQWSIPRLYLSIGRNNLDINGNLENKNLNLIIIINASCLDNAFPGISGKAKGLIKLSGTAISPQLFADITANNFQWKDFCIAHIHVDGSIKYSDQISGKLKIFLAHIYKPGIHINRVMFNTTGIEKQHDIQLQIQSKTITGQLHILGNFNRHKRCWTGKLYNKYSDYSVNQPLQQYQVIKSNYDNNGIEQKLDSRSFLCKEMYKKFNLLNTVGIHTEGNRCTVINFKNGYIFNKIKLSSSNVPLEYRVCSEKTDTDFSKKSFILFKRSIKTSKVIYNNMLPVEFDNFNLKFVIHNNYVEMEWLIHLTNDIQFDGRSKMMSPYRHRNLFSHIFIPNFDLARINGFFLHEEKISGILSASLQISGNSENPQLFGQIKLNGIDIDSNFIPFHMQPSQLKINFSGMRSTLEGKIYTQSGVINLRGNADWTQLDRWYVIIAVKGSKVRVSTSSILHLEISPDIVFKATPKLLTLDGRVDVPWARIMVNKIPENAVGISNDEIMLNEKLKPIEQNKPNIPIKSSLIMHIGNNVQIDAFGLKSKLIGDLQVIQNEQGINLNGQLNLLEGHFYAYGQDLLVRKGELLFSGPPDQPLLNIKAIRNPEVTEDGVIAGINVTGTADEPKTEIFSDPKMSQQEILSYLLRGHRINSGQNDSTVMTSMLVGIGIAQSGQILDKLGKTLGVNNLSLDTQGIGDSAQVVLSGYLFPGFQIKYGFGIFDSLATFTLRYRLIPKLYLEVVSGINQALDLLYQFEF